MCRKYMPSEKRCADALRKSNGRVTFAAKRLDIHPTSLYNIIRESEVLQEVLQEAREKRLDVAETGLDKALLAEQPWAIKMTLEQLGQSRGYGQKGNFDITSKGNELKPSINIVVNGSQSPLLEKFNAEFSS